LKPQLKPNLVASKPFSLNKKEQKQVKEEIEEEV